MLKYHSWLKPTFFVGCALALSLTLPMTVSAENDSSIKGIQRASIQAAMSNFVVTHSSENGIMLHYDSKIGELVSLHLDKLHSDIMKKGDFFVSCADFISTDGRKYDLDFLVLPKGDAYQVNQAIVHSVDGKKREYYLED
ncbi:hypothetical protein [Candidatus Parabeggiatoa sp. HSG14]|uniref:hypothetical protein n=1 Tax=Candidatus Parabeggiatoa sp. HSG14 TaxID=3055593 RepID=UPI0025A892F4|nr:hypothetical protein [Thiotrichales bacterium HSG14]